MAIKIDPKIKKIIAMVKGKRALAVIHHIEKHGLVTTEDLEKMGYIHPPRAVRLMGTGTVNQLEGEFPNFAADLTDC